MSMILRLCERTVLLNRGNILADGDTNTVTRAYLSMGSSSPAARTWAENEAPGDHVAKLRSITIRNCRGNVSENISIDEEFTVEVEYHNYTTALRPTAIIHFYNDEGVCLFASNDWNNKEWWKTERKPGIVHSTCQIPANLLAEGKIIVLVAIGTYNPNVVHAIYPDAVSLHIIDRSDGTGARGYYSGGKWPGVVRPFLNWNVEYKDMNDER